ncbi:MAG: beta-propeller fold lactonase family protein [Chthoniobacterales bacterium]
MKNPTLSFRSRWKALLCPLSVVACVAVWSSAVRAASPGQDRASIPGTVYTASNASTGNEVFAFDRAANGALTFSASYSTGGTGNDAELGGLGNQGGVVLSPDGRWLLVVNPGSDSLSAFAVQSDGSLLLTDNEPSGGVLPTSVTVSRNLVYVLNAADAGNISGFTINNQGVLTAIPGSIQPLSGMPVTAPAQIQFSPRGSALLVTEKATNLIDTYFVGRNGVAGPPTVNASVGETPFGFAFSRDGHLVVSEAFGGLPDIGTVSSYSTNSQGELDVITPSEPTHAAAPCWIVITKSGNFTYTTNTGSGTVTGFRINRATGQLTQLDADGVTAETGEGSTPIDEALSADSAYLYVLNSGTHEIIGFRVNNANGELQETTLIGGLPVAAFGLAAR